MKETWHSAVNGAVFDLVQYDYLNGAPFRMKIAHTPVELTGVFAVYTYYLQYNWHGDATMRVGTEGDADNQYELGYDPWGGGQTPQGNAKNYYGWNGAW